ncbi:MAG: DUF1858 domain-containing protein [Candidatus Kapaibacterium sp.]
MRFTKDTNIEELIRVMPAAASYFTKYNIRVMQAGSVIWGSIEDIAKRKDYNDEDVAKFVKELNEKYDSMKRR